MCVWYTWPRDIYTIIARNIHIQQRESEAEVKCHLNISAPEIPSVPPSAVCVCVYTCIREQIERRVQLQQAAAPRAANARREQYY